MGQSHFSTLAPSVVEVGEYHPGPEALLVEMDFAKHKVYNPEAVKGLDKRRVRAVDLVFTRYPYHVDEWELHYDSLMQRRYEELERLAPGAFEEEGVKWKVVLQTDCRNLAEAKALFHGFAVYSQARTEVQEENPVEIEPRFEIEELESNLEKALELYHGRSSFYDSTCMEVLDRHPEWRHMALAIDWTASMFRHGAQLLHWFTTDIGSGRAVGYAFFNDGDGKWDEEKEIGNTGGVYLAAASKPDSILAAIRKAALGGSGGDHRENDLEAVLAALESFPEAKEIVLIADNTGPVRDLELLEYIDRPVRVLLTGVYKNNFQADYFTIAYHTGGSVHTRDNDYWDISELLVHDGFELGDYAYKLRGSRFIKQKLN